MICQRLIFNFIGNCIEKDKLKKTYFDFISFIKIMENVIIMLHYEMSITSATLVDIRI